MIVLENNHGTALARLLVAVVVISGRVALDRVLPRGRLASAHHTKHDDAPRDV